MGAWSGYDSVHIEYPPCIRALRCVAFLVVKGNHQTFSLILGRRLILGIVFYAHGDRYCRPLLSQDGRT